MSLNLAIIGSGNIAPYHIEAAQEIGFRVVAIAGSNNSQSAQILSQKYEIPNYFEKTSDLLESGMFDCLSVMIPPNESIKLVQKISTVGVPALIEKPVGLKSDLLNNHLNIENIFVGFNRRFYKTINELKYITLNTKGILNFEAVESVIHSSNPFIFIKNEILNNTIHLLDLIKFILGEYDLKDYIFSTVNNTINCRIFRNGDFCGNFQVSFNSIKNTRIEFDGDKIFVSLKPLEHLQKFNLIEIIEPNKVISVRKYLPIWSDNHSLSTINEDSDFKPGFIAQYEAFYKFCIDGNKDKLANLYDAQYALTKCEEIIFHYEKAFKSHG